MGLDLTWFGPDDCCRCCIIDSNKHIVGSSRQFEASAELKFVAGVCFFLVVAVNMWFVLFCVFAFFTFFIVPVRVCLFAYGVCVQRHVGIPRFSLTSSVIWLKALSRPSPVCAQAAYMWYGLGIWSRRISFSISLSDMDDLISCLFAMIMTGMWLMSSRLSRLYSSWRASSMRSRSDESTT